MKIMLLLRQKCVAKLAIVLLISCIFNICSPALAFALTGGPSQPEFSSFEPVSTADMVNKFTGDFSYNIPLIEVPGPDGSSYPLSLSYHSGAGAEEEASWVGYGWTVNPGAINRTTRGFPDDFAGSTVQYWNKAPKNWTATLGVGAGTELFGNDQVLGVNAQVALRYNNYTGFGKNVGLGVSLGKGMLSLGYQESDGNHSFSARVNPMAIINGLKQANNVADAPETTPTETHTKSFVQKAAMHYLQKVDITALGGNRGLLDFNEVNRATAVANYEGESYNVSAGFEGNFSFVPAGGTANAFGSYTSQENVARTNLDAYGFMYSATAVSRKNSDEENTVSDFYKEKDTPYNERDNFLALPFNNADIFNVSGEGVGGAFRLHHDMTGEFGPNRNYNELEIQNLTGEFSLGAGAGANIGFGADGGVGTQSTEETSWAELNNRNLLDFSSPSAKGGIDYEGVYFKFANDLGSDSNVEGTRGQVIDDKAIAAKLQQNGLGFDYDLGSDLLTAMGQSASAARPTRGSYIGYHTLRQMRRGLLTRYCRRASVWDNSFSNTLSANAIQRDLIGELAVTNDAGKKYVYGQPLYSRSESNLQYGVQGVSSTQVKQNYLVYTNKQETKVGEVRLQPYATTYLLTEVTTPDYTDRTLDGPTTDDFGGYTAFYYNKTEDFNANTQYHWRFPYTGHIYERNSLSDPLDDMGSVAQGNKEVAYLSVIRTKTHTAIFETENRLDALDAASDIDIRNQENTNLAARRRSLSLSKIYLYSNKDVESFGNSFRAKAGAIPIKTVNFAYNYSLCQQTPNSDAPTKGKLTLVKVWFEFNGVKNQLQNQNQQINPYVFGYNYPVMSAGGIDYPTEYDGLENYGSGLAQNPNYSPFNTDAWGNYQAFGEERHRNLMSWVSQVSPPNNTFDPAAWQLKTITLPSKAQIHIQYEQDDYAYVQDRKVHAMVSLVNEAGQGDSFLVNPASAGVTTTDLETMCTLINELYENTGRKMFFKFLYGLTGDRPELSDCSAEYVSGYVELRHASVEGNNIRLQIGGNGYTLPSQVCRNFVQTQRQGRLVGGNCDPSTSGVQDNTPERVVEQLMGWIGRDLLPWDNTCLYLKPQLSYFKLPLPGSKKGGGVRVKRLLTYANDPALDGESVLYGSEYSYKLPNSSLSSGVATNEPAAMRSENALVEFIPRLSQSWKSKIISGPDRKQAEGPLGESVLPGPSVGYSYVVEKNIHSGKTNSGFTISEFYTAHDFPVRYDQTIMDRHNFYLPAPGGLFNYVTNNTWAAQGFSVILNNMHGQLRRTATYAGTYMEPSAVGIAPPKPVLMSEQVQEYFKPSDKITVWNSPNQGADASYVSELPGREVDITVAQHAIQEKSYDLSVEFDESTGVIPFFPIPVIIPFGSVWPAASVSDATFYTHTTTKVVRYPAIPKSVLTYKDGIYHLEENLAFDQYSGKPVAVRSQDEYSGKHDKADAFSAAYLKEDVLATWVYPEKRGKFENEGATIITWAQVTGSATDGFYLSSTDCNALRLLRKGDLLILNNDPQYAYISGGVDYAYQRVQLYRLNSNQTAPPNNVITIEVLASGNTNELGLPIGSTTYHKDNVSDNTPIDLRANRTKYFDPNASGSLLARDFNAKLAVTPVPTTGAVKFKVSSTTGGYTGIDAAGFYGQIIANASGLRGKTDGLTIDNLVFMMQSVNGAAKIVLISFEVTEPGYGPRLIGVQ